jgi:hypothetical protein
MCFLLFSGQTAIIYANSINQSIFVMATHCVFFKAETGPVNII